MLIKIFGGIDVILGLILIFLNNIALPEIILLIFGIGLIIKSSIGFLKDFGSWVDLSCGIIFLITAIIVVPLIISVIFGILIIQKGVFSFL